MKRILILTDPFTPPAYVPRVRFMAHYLQEKGYEVEVCTEQLLDSSEPPYFGFKLHEMPYYRYHGFRGNAEWLMKFIGQLSFSCKDKAFTRYCNTIMERGSFDIILCSCFHTFPLPTAFALSKAWDLPLVVDLRDIEEQCPGTSYYAHRMPNLLGLGKCVTKLYRRINLKRRNRVLQAAAAVTTVSRWHVDTLSKYNPNTYLIYNGYDASLFVPKNIKSNRFSLCYTGRLYEPVMQDPSLMFEAVEHLLKKRLIHSDNLSLDFYVDPASKKKLEHYVTKYRLQQWTHFHDFVPTQQVPEVLYRSSILLVFSNIANKESANGIMTTKFYEALGVEKPILCVRSDEAFLAKLIELTECGVAAENCKQVEKFILKQYKQWQELGYTRMAINPIVKEEYSRQRQSEYLIDVIKQVIEKP